MAYLDEVAVAAHEQAGVAVLLTLVAGEVPLEQGLVPGSGNEHVHCFLVGVGGEGNGGDPSVVANESTDLCGASEHRRERDSGGGTVE